MRYLLLAAAAGAAIALVACKPSKVDVTDALPAHMPTPVIPHAPSAPVVPPDPEPDPMAQPMPESAEQILMFTGPMDLTIRLSTTDNFATALMTINSEHALSMHRVRASSGTRLENGEGVSIEFKNGVGTAQFSPDNVIDIEEYRLP